MKHRLGRQSRWQFDLGTPPRAQRIVWVSLAASSTVSSGSASGGLGMVKESHTLILASPTEDAIEKGIGYLP